MGRVRYEAKSAEPAAILVPQLLNEAQHSQGCHPRAIKELCVCRGNGADEFLEVWIRSLRPVFLMSKRESAVDRVISFVSGFIAHWDEEIAMDCEAFFEAFLTVLLEWTASKDKTVRFRACQMISEAISKLEPHFTVKEELWDRMTSTMQERMQDRMTAVRVLASNALARLIIADDIQNDPTVRAYRKALACDPSADVRRMVVKSMPAANATVSDVVQRIADVSDSVRKAAYQTIAERLCISGLSITQRATTLGRGLAERVSAVRAECEKLLDLWLREDCDGDTLILLRYLDVETHEKVAEMAMTELLNQNLIKPPSHGLRQFLDDPPVEGRRMSAEEALFWRVYCTHICSEAKTKGREAANTGGAEAVVQAAVAADRNDYFESILPPTVADFVRLVEGHLRKGSANWFAARQLLILATLMDFTDATSRKDAGALVHRLLREKAPSYEHGTSDDNDSEEWVGDGLNLGGEESWAKAVADLARHVHAASGEFEGVLAEVVAEVGGPCREGGADARQWLHCLAVTGLLLENIPSLDTLAGRPIEPHEIAHSLLLPAAKHLHPEVQRAGIRCLGIFCALERNPSSTTVGQLFHSLRNGRPQIQKIALKAMFDLISSRGAAAVECALRMTSGTADSPIDPRDLHGHPSETNPAAPSTDETVGQRVPILETLADWLDDELASNSAEDDAEFLHCMSDIAAEGFSKILLQNRRLPEILLLQEKVVEELLLLYFTDRGTRSPRLEQCLAVFFRVWCSLSAENKRCISKVFIPVIRKKWPGVNDRRDRQGTVVVARKHATEVAHFMLHLLHLAAFPKAIREDPSSPVTPGEGRTSNEMGTSPKVIGDEDVDEGREALAIRICAEVKSFSTSFKSLSMARRTYSLMLCRVLALIDFSPSQQEKIKALLCLLPRVIDWIPVGEKLVVKGLNAAVSRLKELDCNPDAGLSDEELQLFMERMGLQDNMEADSSPEELVTPGPHSTVKSRGARSVRRQSAPADTFIPASTRSLRKNTEVQKLRSQNAARNREISPNLTRRRLSSARARVSSKGDKGSIRGSSLEEESDVASVSSVSDSDYD